MLNYAFPANTIPAAVAEINGMSEINGLALFYPHPESGMFVQVEMNNLPDEIYPNSSGFFGMHIHEFGNCTEPFNQTGNHHNPDKLTHPNHAGDFPPLLSYKGYAWMTFYNGRLTIDEILNRSLIIHESKDDFTTQPSGNSGQKIACGVIKELKLSLLQ